MDFSISEVPTWRKQSSSSSILLEVSRKLEKISRKISIEKKTSLFIDFVHQSNLGEDVGTQTKEETKKVLTAHLAELKNTVQRKRETLNTFKALQAVAKLHEEMDFTGMITVQQICDIHRILLNGLHRNCGNIRDTQVYTITPDGEKYYYTCPEKVEARLYDVVDRHNYHMQRLQESNADQFEKLTFLVKTAAWLLFHFVDTHPFSDGNGRMCRLLAGYTMMVMLPFPVHPYHTSETKDSNGSRQDYLEAIISCRRDPKHEPSLISALIVDGVYSILNSCLESS